MNRPIVFFKRKEDKTERLVKEVLQNCRELNIEPPVEINKFIINRLKFSPNIVVGPKGEHIELIKDDIPNWVETIEIYYDC